MLAVALGAIVAVALGAIVALGALAVALGAQLLLYTDSVTQSDTT